MPCRSSSAAARNRASASPSTRRTSSALDQVLAHLAVEVEEVLDDGLGVVAQVRDHAGVPVDDPRAELVARGVGDDPGVRLVADPQPVVGEQAGGVGVVGRDGGLEDVLVLGCGVVQRPRVGQRLADLGAQLARGLGGEREAEDLVGPHLAGQHEVDDAGRHQRGLARAGTGDDDRGREGRGDRGPLLLAGLPRGAHRRGEVGGRVEAAGLDGHDADHRARRS